MGQYRKKPIVINAEQWFPHKDVEGVLSYNPSMLSELDYIKPDGTILKVPSMCAVIQTLEGYYIVKSCDWIITGVHGEKYPCDDEIFQKSYEMV